LFRNPRFWYFSRSKTQTLRSRSKNWISLFAEHETIVCL